MGWTCLSQSCQLLFVDIISLWVPVQHNYGPLQRHVCLWHAGKSDVLLAVSVTTSSAVQPSVLKEGVLEKKGHGAAFLSWPKRVVRITKGELYYAKPEDPEVCV